MKTNKFKDLCCVFKKFRERRLRWELLKTTCPRSSHTFLVLSFEKQAKDSVSTWALGNFMHKHDVSLIPPQATVIEWNFLNDAHQGNASMCPISCTRWHCAQMARKRRLVLWTSTAQLKRPETSSWWLWRGMKFLWRAETMGDDGGKKKTTHSKCLSLFW